MNRLFLLDCTLRDGCYVNNWVFGQENINNIVHGLEKTGVDVLELGFLRDEPFNPNSSNLPNIESADRLLTQKRKEIVYSVMLEAFNPYPLDKLNRHHEKGIDLIRVCIWKRCLAEHMAYCKTVAHKGYRLSIQPSRVEQYNDDEFIEMLKRANELNPYAVYVVDTWGTQSPYQICHYLELADKYLDSGVKIGYHGHNNKLQALSCAKAAIEMDLNRDLCIDSSIMGMGRGAGNLNTEIIMDFLNKSIGTQYDVDGIIDIFNLSLREVYHNTPWGYSMYYFLCSINNCNPSFATYFSENLIGEDLFLRFLQSLSDKEKIVFSKGLIEERISAIK